jgi:hypothetical protein
MFIVSVAFVFPILVTLPVVTDTPEPPIHGTFETLLLLRNSILKIDVACVSFSFITIDGTTLAKIIKTIIPQIELFFNQMFFITLDYAL